MELADAFRFQGAACAELGSPMYSGLLGRAAEDLEAGGPVREVLAGHEHDPGPSALALRLLGSVHRLVLEHRAGDLALFYPSVGGTWELDAGWAAFEELLRTEPDAVRSWLDRAPQTNEVGRAAALYGGLRQLPSELPVRLFEIGASAGLNLLADRFTYVDAAGRRFGAPASPLVVDAAWKGRSLDGRPGPTVVERAGCDIHPVDAATVEGRLLLTAYLWPDQRHRLERLRAALRVAAEHPVEVRRQDARSFVGSLSLVEGTTTVLWHSVMWQYLPPDQQEGVSERLEELGREATELRPFVHLRAEPSRRAPDAPHEFLVWMRSWPGGERRLLGRMVPHGAPVVWE
jgi:hypothetical protein